MKDTEITFRAGADSSGKVWIKMGNWEKVAIESLKKEQNINMELLGAIGVGLGIAILIIVVIIVVYFRRKRKQEEEKVKDGV
jgi:hypothetical protein